jgi:transposase
MTKKYIISLEQEEQRELAALISKRNAKAAAVKRAYILLAADTKADNLTDEQIAQRYKVSVRSIEGLRKRFVEEGFPIALYGKKRTLFKQKIFDGRVEAHLIALRCSDPPKGRSGWTLQLLADKMIQLGYVESISYETVRQLLKKK